MRRSRMQRATAVAALILAVVATAGAIRLAGGVDRNAGRSRSITRRPSAPSRVRRATTTPTRARTSPRTPVLRGAAARRARVPILMYHVIGTPPAGIVNPGLWVAPADFRAQVRSLAAASYVGVTLAQVVAAWHHGAALPRRPVVFSFDDGYASDATIADPVLHAAGWPGVLNLEIRNAGPNGIPVHLMLRMIRDGWEVDSHSVDHPDLTTLAPGPLGAELVRSRAWIRRTLGVPADFLCYPAGRYDARVIAAVRSAGYRGATTERPGRATARDSSYELPRIRVAGGETAAQVLAGL